MTIDDPDVIDIIATGEGEARLIIADHLGWTLEDVDADLLLPELDHLDLLRRKLQRYVDFIESGQVYDVRPAARDLALIIEIRNKYPPTASAHATMLRFADAVAACGAMLRFSPPRDDGTRH